MTLATSKVDYCVGMAKPSLIGASVLGLSLLACSNDGGKPAASPPSSSSSSTSTPTATSPVASGAPSFSASAPAASSAPSSVPAGLEEVTAFGDNPGGLKMYVHASAKAPQAVVLALHGCGQTAADYLRAGWNEVGDREGLVIVYAEQLAANNPHRCFRWYEPAHQGKDGEARSLASMVTAAHARFGTKRAFVTGLSAGGAMASVMLAAYPELFEAGAVMTGIPYKCASTATEAFACMKGKSQPADAWAALVPKPAAAPRVSIWQGDTDEVVNPHSGEELVKQWARVNAVPETPAETKTEGGAMHRSHKDTKGIVRVESWTIPGMGHGLALDPKSGCGTAGAFTLNVGLCSTQRAAAFFLSPLTSPPTQR